MLAIDERSEIDMLMNGRAPCWLQQDGHKGSRYGTQSGRHMLAP